MDVPAVILDMETKLNKTLAPVQCQVAVLAVRAVRSGSTRRDRAAFGACGVPGPQPWVQPLWRRGGDKHTEQGFQ